MSKSLDRQVRERAADDEIAVSTLLRLLLAAYVFHGVTLMHLERYRSTAEMAEELRARREEDKVGEAYSARTVRSRGATM